MALALPAHREARFEGSAWPAGERRPSSLLGEHILVLGVAHDERAFGPGVDDELEAGDARP